MKTIICLAAAVILAVSAAGCGNTGDTSEASSASSQTQIEVAAGYERYDLGEALDTVTAGFGAQIDTDVYMPWNNLTADEEAMLEKRIAEMNLQFTRIKFFPEFYLRIRHKLLDTLFVIFFADKQYISRFSHDAIFNTLNHSQSF